MNMDHFVDWLVTVVSEYMRYTKGTCHTREVFGKDAEGVHTAYRRFLVFLEIIIHEAQN